MMKINRNVKAFINPSLSPFIIWPWISGPGNCSSVSPLQFGLGYLEQESVLQLVLLHFCLECLEQETILLLVLL